jgi:hypothetical protein
MSWRLLRIVSWIAFASAWLSTAAAGQEVKPTEPLEGVQSSQKDQQSRTKKLVRGDGALTPSNSGTDQQLEIRPPRVGTLRVLPPAATRRVGAGPAEVSCARYVINVRPSPL